MAEDFLDNENLIADERARAEKADTLSLQQPISELPDLHPVVSVDSNTTVGAAVAEMVSQRVGCLLICEGGKLVGLFTERDVLCKVVATGIDTDNTQVSELMTPNPEALHVDSPLVFALHRMAVGGYRHVPLMNDDQQPVAVVSMRDIVKHIVSVYSDQILNLPDEPEQIRWKGRDGG